MGKNNIVMLLGMMLVPTIVIAGEYTGSIQTGIESGIGGYVIASPTSSPAPGTYTTTQTVTFTGSGVYGCYTTNGIDPVCNWTELSCATGNKYQFGTTLTTSSTTTYKFLTCYPKSESSPVSTFTYTITPPSTSGGGGGGGGGGGFGKDNCIDGDKSGDMFDKLCYTSCDEYKTCIGRFTNDTLKSYNCGQIPNGCSTDPVNQTGSNESNSGSILGDNNYSQTGSSIKSRMLSGLLLYSDEQLRKAQIGGFDTSNLFSSFQIEAINQIEGSLDGTTFDDEDISKLILLLKKYYYNELDVILLTSKINGDNNYSKIVDKFILMLKEISKYEKGNISKSKMVSSIKEFLIYYNQYKKNFKELTVISRKTINNYKIKLYSIEFVSTSSSKVLSLLNKRLENYLNTNNNLSQVQIQEIQKSYNLSILALKYMLDIDMKGGLDYFKFYYEYFIKITK